MHIGVGYDPYIGLTRQSLLDILVIILLFDIQNVL